MLYLIIYSYYDKVFLHTFRWQIMLEVKHHNRYRIHLAVYLKSQQWVRLTLNILLKIIYHIK